MCWEGRGCSVSVLSATKLPWLNLVRVRTLAHRGFSMAVPSHPIPSHLAAARGYEDPRWDGQYEEPYPGYSSQRAPGLPTSPGRSRATIKLLLISQSCPLIYLLQRRFGYCCEISQHSFACRPPRKTRLYICLWIARLAFCDVWF